MSEVTRLRVHPFNRFAYWHRESGDIDPAYPVVRMLGGDLQMSGDEHDSFIMLYVAYYDLGSAVSTWMEGWRPGRHLTDLQLHRPTGTERRAHRYIRRFVEHTTALGILHHQYGTWRNMLWNEKADNPRAQWVSLLARLQSIPGNGRWAAYKTGEMLKVCGEWDVEPTDAGHAFSTGPRKGLADLHPHLGGLTGNDPRTIAVLNRYTEELSVELGQPVEQVETALCDWHSLTRGHYYVGHDIDLMLEQAHRTPVDAEGVILQARDDIFDEIWMGEWGGWDGVRRDLNHLYRDTGKIEWWE